MNKELKAFIILFPFSLAQTLFAQTPLLPLLNDSTTWQVMTGQKGGVLDYVTERIVFQTLGDSILNGKAYTILGQRGQQCDECYCSGIKPLCQPITDTLFLRQEKNTLVTSSSDTLFSFIGTTVGDSVLVPSPRREYLKITNIDTVEVGGRRVRLFVLLGSFGIYMYFDGIGFSNSGPIYNYLADAPNDGTARLECYQNDGTSYQYQKPNFSISSAGCISSLSFEQANISSAIKVFLNSLRELEHEIPALKIAIYNMSGQVILINQNATRTNLSGLINGIYIAHIDFQDILVKIKFRVE